MSDGTDEEALEAALRADEEADEVDTAQAGASERGLWGYVM